MIECMKTLDTAITVVGGVGKLAAALGVAQPVVSNWRARGTRPDAVHCVAIERVTNGAVRRAQFRVVALGGRFIHARSVSRTAGACL